MEVIGVPTKRLFSMGGEDMIKEIRQKRGISQNKLAKAVGISQSALSDIETGVTKNPRFNTIMKIADVLKVPVESLVRRTPC